MITLKETVELTCNNSINRFSDILGKKIRENYRAEDGAVSRLELFYLMTVMPDIIVERKNFYRQIFHLENQIVFSSLTGHQTCSKTEPGGILSLRQLPNVRANAATWLVVRGKRLENRQKIHLKIGMGNLPVKAGKERFGCGPWDKSEKYGPFGEMQRNWRGMKLAVQQSRGGFDPCSSRQISMPARLPGSLLTGIKNVSFQTESLMRGQDQFVLTSKGLTEPKGDIALQSNFLEDSAGDINIIQRCEKPAEPSGGIVEHGRVFSFFIRDLILQRKKLEESKMKLILQRERLEGSIREVIRQSEKLAGSKQDIIRQRGKQSEPKGDLIQPSRIFLEFERDFILQRAKQSEWKKELILQREKLLQPKKKGILQRGKLSEPIKKSILRSETMADSKRKIIRQSKIFSEFNIGHIQRIKKQSELKGNIIQQSRILPELKRELIQRVEKQSEQRGDIIQRSRILPESTRGSILQTGNLTEIKRELLPQRENFAKPKTAAVLTDIKQINFDSKITLPRDNYLNLWENTTLKMKSTANLRDNAVWQTKEMANLHGSSIRHTESLTELREGFSFQNEDLTILQKNTPRQDNGLTEPMGDTTRKEEPLIHLPDQTKPQADAIQPKPGQTDDQKLFQYLCEINEHNLNMQRRLEQIKPEAQNEIPLAIDKKEARKKSLLALKDPEKVLMEIHMSGGNPMSKTDSKVQSILNLADQDTRLLLEDVMAYPKTGQGRAFQITETDMRELNHFLREMAEEPPGFQEISRETEKSQRDAEEIRKETVKITREEMEKNSRVLMQNVEELLQSKMESVSDRVYRELERRLKNDQRRRGY